MDDQKVWKYEDDSNDNLNLIVTAIYENDFRTFKKALAYLAKLRNTSEERLMFEITKAMYWREFRRGRNK